MGYDPKCKELAAHFVAADSQVTPERKESVTDALAQIIQNVIENELEEMH